MLSSIPPSGLTIEEVSVGTGALATAEQKVTVHYAGWLADGKKSDASKDSDDPFEFPFGGSHVIKGWDEGVQGKMVSGTRKLIIVPARGYGARGAGGGVPPSATTVFEADVLGVR
jgi:FKBP-type peptidyl-prolyl cis-trans isomerase FkpA